MSKIHQPSSKISEYLQSLNNSQRLGTQVVFQTTLPLSFLAHHRKWSNFFQNLQIVVVDEVHTYRGVMGSHVAQIFRRLGRICRLYGASPTFVFGSATVADPARLARQLTGLSVTAITKSGAPRSNRSLVFINPETGAIQAAILLLKAALDRELRTIVYTQSRKLTELIALWAGNQSGHLANRISFVNIRGAGNRFQIVASRSGKNKGEIDEFRALRETHPGAIYLHRGDTYMVDSIDLKAKIIKVSRAKVDYFTQVRGYNDTEILEIHEQKPVWGAMAYIGRLRVTDQVTEYETQRSAAEVGGWHRANLMKISCVVLYNSKQDRYIDFTENQIPRFIECLQAVDVVVGFNIKRFDYQVLKGYSNFDFMQLNNLDILEEVKKYLSFRLRGFFNILRSAFSRFD